MQIKFDKKNKTLLIGSITKSSSNDPARIRFWVIYKIDSKRSAIKLPKVTKNVFNHAFGGG